MISGPDSGVSWPHAGQAKAWVDTEQAGAEHRVRWAGPYQLPGDSSGILP